MFRFQPFIFPESPGTLNSHSLMDGNGDFQPFLYVKSWFIIQLKKQPLKNTGYLGVSKNNGIPKMDGLYMVYNGKPY